MALTKTLLDEIEQNFNVNWSNTRLALNIYRKCLTY